MTVIHGMPDEAITELLRTRGALTLREIANAIGYTRHHTRAVVSAMHRAGRVQRRQVATGVRGRPPFVYELKPKQPACGPEVTA